MPRKHEGKFKRIGREFAELLQACWELSPRWTIVFWLFIGISAYDQVRIFPRGYGTFHKIYVLVLELVKWL